MSVVIIINLHGISMQASLSVVLLKKRHKTFLPTIYNLLYPFLKYIFKIYLTSVISTGHFIDDKIWCNLSRSVYAQSTGMIDSVIAQTSLSM